MYRNLYIITGGCLILLAIFLAFFTGSARGRADYAWNNLTEPQTLDPGRMSGQPEGELAIGLFEGLTAYHPETLEPCPSLAESWEVDGLTYTFHFRPDAFWVRCAEALEGGGKLRPVTAADIVYSWKRHLLPETGSEYSYVLYPIAGIEEYEKRVHENWKELVERYKRIDPDASVTGPRSLSPADREALASFRDSEWERLVKVRAPDDRTLEVTLKSPAPYFLTLTSFYPLFAVPREAIEAHGERWIQPENIVVNGPYLLEEWKFNAYIRLRKNPHYWETAEYTGRKVAALRAKPALRDFERRELDLLERHGSFGERGLEVLDALAVEEYNTGLNLYINGDTDRQREVPQEVVGDLIAESRRPGTEFRHLHHGTIQTIYFYNLNMTLSVFRGETGRKLRRALALAIDRRGLVEVVTRAHQKPAYRMVVEGIAGYPSDPLFGSGDLDRDLAEAKRLVAEVRAAGVKVPRLRILYNTSEGHAKIAAFIQSGWKTHLDIDTEPANQEWGVFLDSRRTGNYDIARSGWIGDYPDPNTFLDMFTTGNQNNDPKYSNAWYDRIVLEYCARILEVLETEASRRKVLADIRSWPAYSETAARRTRADGSNLDRALADAFDAFAAAPGEEARLEIASRARLLLFEAAEEMLMHDMPAIPFYFYTTTQLWPPELEGMALNARDSHPLKTLRWKGGERPAGSRYGDFPRLRARLEDQEPGAPAQ